jgi:hypothetical protein
MKLREITEAVGTAYGETGNKVTRKYRCQSGSRKGRLVAKPSTCNAPKNISRSVGLKKTKARLGSNIKVKKQRTQRANPASRQKAKANRGRK